MKKQSGKIDNTKAKSSGKTLRQLAEVIVQEKASEQLASETSMSPVEIQGTLHELRVHQIELEMQNEELRHTQTELIEMKERYFNLYDLAPVGYLTISDKGIIMRANLTASTMLGADRRELIKKRFSEYIAINDQDVYYLKMKVLVETGVPQQYDLRLIKKDSLVFWAHLTFANTTDSDYSIGYSVVITDASERKSFEFSLKESRERYKGLFEYSGVGIGYYSPDGVVISYNRKALENMGGELDDFVGKPLYSIFPEPEADIYMGRLKEALSSDAPIEYEDYLNLNLGSVWFSSTFSKVINDAGEAVGVQIASVDITQRKNAENSLKESEENFKYLFENSTVGKSLTQLSGEINVNVTFCKMLGYTAEELRGKKVQELTHPDDIELTELEMNELISGKKREARFQKRYIRKDGSIMWAEVLSSLRRRDDGSPMYFMASIIDITDRIQAQEALKQSEERFELLFNQAPLGYQSLDFDGRFIEVNQQWLDTLGYRRDEVIGKWFGDFLCPEYVEGFRKRFPIFKAQGFIHSEFEMLSKDGQRLYIAFEGKIGKNERGEFKQTHCILQDITNQKKAEKALIESQEMLSETESIGKVGGWSFNIDTMVQKWTDEVYRIHEIELAPDPSVDAGINFYTKQSRPIIENAVKRAIEHGENFDLELEIITAKGNLRAVHTIGKADLKNRRIYGFFQDITERKRAEIALKENEEKYRLLYTAMSQGLALHEIITDEDGKPVDYVFLDVNESYTRILGVTREMCIGKRITEVMPNVEQYWIEMFGKVALTGEPCYYENYLAASGGYYATYSYSPKIRQFAVLVSDITEKKKYEENLQYLSYHDQLTGLYNRRFFEEELSRLDAKRNLPISLIMADINGLKIINDSFGHDVGDDYLIKLSEVIKTACRADEIIARLGGDEFVIILPNTSGQETANIVNRLKDTISKTKNGSFELSVSFGYDTKEREEQSVSDIIANAENHMYTHKIVERASMRSKTVEMIMSALFEKSGREALHSKRVSKICEEIAAKMAFDRDDMEQIRIAGLVHDIGKIGIDEVILNKTEQLKSEDWPAIRKHPEAGWRILNTTAEFSEIAQFVLHHHEKFDGSGYPNGLKGEEIPIQARIIAIADAYDAMTNVRSYRKAISHDEAIEEIKCCSGTHFDPAIVDVFVH